MVEDVGFTSQSRGGCCQTKEALVVLVKLKFTGFQYLINMSCSRTTSVFQEAYNHSRQKTLILKMIDSLSLSSYQGKSFEDVLSSITNVAKQFPGIGKLGIYDIASGISRYNAIPVERVYIIGDGPKRAAKQLNLPLNKYSCGSRSYLYAEIPDVLTALETMNISVDSTKKSDGDYLETFLCVWQKTQPGASLSKKTTCS